MRLRTATIFMAVGLAALASASAALAKGTLFVVGSGSSTVAAHSIGSLGGLTPVGAAVATGNTPRSAAVSPDAQFLYVSAVGGDNVSVYTIGSSGALTPLTTVTTGANTDPEGIAISPNGLFLYTANQGSNDIGGFTLGANGTPVPNGNTAAAQIKEVAISGTGQFLYATTDAGVRSYSIDQATGALSPIGGVTAAGTNPKGIATTPDGRFFYVTNTGSANITAFSIGADGSPTSLGNFPTGAVPQTVAVSQDGRFVYNANFGSDTVSGFSIGGDGTLTPTNPPTGMAGIQPYGIDAAPNEGVYSSNFNNNGAATVFVFGTTGGGAPAPVTNTPAGVNGSEYQSVAITPNQGPTARFSVAPQGAGQESLFNGDQSTDADGGTVARFDWDFGDGSTLPNGGPSVTHAYAEPGNYQVSLTVTDDEGCSTLNLFTGQTLDCHGSASAQNVQTIQVGTGTAPNLRLFGNKQELAKKVTVKAKTDDDTQGVAKGSISIQNKKGKSALKSFDLKKVEKTIQGGEKTKLKPKLTKKAFKKAKKALKNGGKVTAKVKVTATDEDADKDKDSIKIKIKR